MAFIGLGLSEQAIDKLSKIQVPGQRQEPGSYHCTLMYFGKEVLVKDIRKIIRVTTATIKNQQSFMVKTNLISSFPSQSDTIPIIAKIESSKLQIMRALLKRQYIKENINFDDRYPDYNPHVTLSYMNASSSFKDIKIPKISWEIDKINIWYKDGGAHVKLELPFNKKELEKIILNIKDSE